MKCTPKSHKKQPKITSGSELARPDPSIIGRENLAEKVEKLAVEAFRLHDLSLKKLSELRPMIARLRQLFMDLKPGEAIAGCRTWTEYCERILHRTDRRIRQILGGANPASERHGRKFLLAKKDMTPEASLKTIVVLEAYNADDEQSGRRNTTVGLPHSNSKHFPVHIEAPPRYLSEKQVTMGSAPTLNQIADPLKVDPKRYKLEFENERVRVLRANYGPREKSVMHGHPATLAIFLTENRARFTFPGGETAERSWTAGQTTYISAEGHLTENLTDGPLELVLVELKS